jgi:TPR repeat protein
LRLARPLAEQGNADAQFGVGWMYDNGQGVPQDDARAVVWSRKAADQGYARAQLNLGVMYAMAEACRRTIRKPTCGSIWPPRPLKIPQFATRLPRTVTLWLQE